MATYIGDYKNDLRKLFQRVNLQVYLIDAALENESRVVTSEEFDALFIPDIFYAALPYQEDKKAVCTIDNGSRTNREGICVISENQQFHITCPFPGGSTEFQLFFDDLRANERIQRVYLKGERISRGKFDWYVKH